MHTWLTLPTFDVVDTAMVPAIHSVNRAIPFADDIIDHPDRWEAGCVYHSVVVGLPLVDAFAGVPITEALVGLPLASGLRRR